MTIKMGLLGATGRMGKAVLECTTQDKNFEIIAAVSHSKSTNLGHKIGGILITDDLQYAFKNAQVVVDFSCSQSVTHHLDLALEFKKPLLIGVTGLDNDTYTKINQTSLKIPLLITSNTSIGVTVMQIVTEKISSVLNDEFDVEISETHHHHKIDAPSGTALSLGKAVAAGRQQKLEDIIHFNNHLEKTSRQSGKVGFSFQRGGGVFGDHTVSFFGEEEIIQLHHRCLSRNIFAKGALLAAKWLKNQPEGLYDMRDVIGIK